MLDHTFLFFSWEGRRHPTGPARALLRILDVDPEHAVEALYNQ